MPLQSIPQLLFPFLSVSAALNPLNPFLEGSLFAWVIFAIHGLLTLTPYPRSHVYHSRVSLSTSNLPRCIVDGNSLA